VYVHGVTVEFDFHHVQATNNNKGGVILQPQLVRKALYLLFIFLLGSCKENVAIFLKILKN